MSYIFDDELISKNWKGYSAAVVCPERMIALNHVKKARLVGGMIQKYSLLVSHLDLNSKVLDVCCGSGFGAAYLSKCGFDVTGVDIQFPVPRKHSNVSWIKRNILEDFPFHNFDAVVCVDAIEHFEKEDQPSVIKNLSNATRAGGLILIDTPRALQSRRASREHKWELSWNDFGSLVEEDINFKWIKRFAVVHEHNFSFLVYGELPSHVDSRNVDQIILLEKG